MDKDRKFWAFKDSISRAVEATERCGDSGSMSFTVTVIGYPGLKDGYRSVRKVESFYHSYDVADGSMLLFVTEAITDYFYKIQKKHKRHLNGNGKDRPIQSKNTAN